MMKMNRLMFLLLVFLMAACASAGTEEEKGIGIVPKFESYWYDGKAELARYDLRQARYGEIHEGEAVMIFVTEDFDIQKQVKSDNPTKAQTAKALKLNFTKKFNTGIYPYSLMTSVFSPVYAPESGAWKVTTSGQEWCGHVFTQINQKDGMYDINTYSYFESEGDKSQSIEKVFLEDEIWNLIRLNPELLPVGEVEVLPSSMILRLTHQQFTPQKAMAKLEKRDEWMTYSLEYDSRKLIIEFEKDFPFKILAWEEEYKSGWGKSARILRTTATLQKDIRLDYWSKNSVADSLVRQEFEN
jgi:hypothetical protein